MQIVQTLNTFLHKLPKKLNNQGMEALSKASNKICYIIYSRSFLYKLPNIIWFLNYIRSFL